MTNFKVFNFASGQKKDKPFIIIFSHKPMKEIGIFEIEKKLGTYHPEQKSVYLIGDNLYFVFNDCAGQTGSLGVYNIARNKWVFSGSGDELALRGAILFENLIIGYSNIKTWGWQAEEIVIIKDDRPYPIPVDSPVFNFQEIDSIPEPSEEMLICPLLSYPPDDPKNKMLFDPAQSRLYISLDGAIKYSDFNIRKVL